MSKSDEQAAYVDSLDDSIQQYRYDTDGEGYVNASFYSGKHHIYWDPSTHQVVEPPIRYSNEIRLNIALATTIIQRLIARLIRDRKTWAVAPTNNESGLIMASRGAQRTLQHHWEFGGLRRLSREEVLPSMTLYGAGWYSVKWDPDAGALRPQKQPQDPAKARGEAPPSPEEQALAPLAPELLEAPPEAQPEGEIVFRAPSYYSVLCDPFATRYEHLRYVIERDWVPIEDAIRIGAKAKDLEPTNADAGSAWQQRLLSGLSNTMGTITNMFGGGGGSSQKVPGIGMRKDDGQVLLKRLWTAPTDKYPEGRLVVVCNGVTLDSRDNPYGFIPFVPVFSFPVPGTSIRVPVMSLLRSLSLAIDRLVSRYLMNITSMGNPMWAATRGMGLEPNQLTDGIGQVMLWDPDPKAYGKEPKRIEAPYLGSFTGDAVNILRELMYEVAGLNEASRGENPSGGRSAEMIHALAAKDEEGNLPLQQSFDDALGDLGTLTLKVARKFYKEDRFAKVIGPGGDVMVHEIQQTDFDHAYEVKVIGDAGLPRSWSDRVNMAIQLAGAKVVNVENPQQQMALLRWMEFAPLNSLWDQGEETERARIHKENLEMLVGSVVQVEAKDLHQMHLDDHRKFMRSSEYNSALEQMPKVFADKVNAIFYAHTDEHDNWVRIGNGLQPLDDNQTPEAGVAAPPALGDPMVSGMGGGIPVGGMGNPSAGLGP